MEECRDATPPAASDEPGRSGRDVGPRQPTTAAESTVERLRGDLAHRERQIAALRAITEGLFAHLTTDELVREILRVAIEVLDAEVGSIQLHDPKTDRLVFRYVQDPKAADLIGHSMPTTQGISGKVFRTGVPNLTHKAKEQPEFNGTVDEMTGYQTESMLTVPLRRFGGEPSGIIQILNGSRRFDNRDLEVLEVLSGQAGTSLETQRLVQAARRAELVDIIADISHDVKNMLPPIKTGTQTLGNVLCRLCDTIEDVCRGRDEDPVSEQVTQAVATARSDFGWLIDRAVAAADQLVARTKEIIDAAHGELTPFHAEEANLNETVTTLVDGLKLLSSDAQVELRKELDESLPAVEFEPRPLYNALFNLAYNAIEATPAGGSVTFRTRFDPARPGEVLVEVEDTGEGMPEDVREVAFTDQAKTTKKGGSGLGTRIVANVVERHSGKLDVRSAPGAGTTVGIWLPIRQQTVD